MELVSEVLNPLRKKINEAREEFKSYQHSRDKYLKRNYQEDFEKLRIHIEAIIEEINDIETLDKADYAPATVAYIRSIRIQLRELQEDINSDWFHNDFGEAYGDLIGMAGLGAAFYAWMSGMAHHTFTRF